MTCSLDPFGAPSQRARAKTISIKRLSKRALLEEQRRLEHANATDPVEPRPLTFAECERRGIGTIESPCAYVSCRWNLALDVDNRTGSIKVNFPGAVVDGAIDVSLIPATCALVIADSDGLTLEQVGEILNLTRERVRQIETKGLQQIAELARLAALQDDHDETDAAALVVHEHLSQYAVDHQRDANRETEAEDESEDEQPRAATVSRTPRWVVVPMDGGLSTFRYTTGARRAGGIHDDLHSQGLTTDFEGRAVYGLPDELSDDVGFSVQTKGFV